VQSNRTVLIWDSADPISDSEDINVLWQNYKVVYPEKEVSIPKLVEKGADELRSKYLALIYDLGEVKIGKKRTIDYLEIRLGFSYWWMTRLIEKCNYSKSQQINNIIKLMAFEEWSKSKDFTIIKVATNNRELAESIKSLTSQLGLIFNWIKLPSKKPEVKIVRRIYSGLPNIIKAPIWLSYYLIDRWKLKGDGLENWKKSIATVTFTSYFFNLDVDAARKGVYKDRYWTKIPDLLRENSVESNWLHIYVKNNFLPTMASARELIERYNRSHGGIENHLFLDSFLGYEVVRRTIIDWLQLLSKYSRLKSPIKQRADHFWPLIKSDLKVSLLGVTAVHNILLRHLFSSAMQMLPTQKKGLYIQENQGWEFGFVSVWRECDHGQIIGVPHSTVRYWDLRYFFDARLYEQNGELYCPFPDKVAVNGEAAKNQYIGGGYAEDKLVEVEGLRYLQLEKVYSNNSVLGKEYEGVNNILVLGDYLHKYTKYQMEFLQEACKFINVKINFIVKPHPICPIRSQDYEKINMIITDHPIDKLIGQCVMAFTSSGTSAAVDAYSAGKKVITLLDGKTLNLSPLRNCRDVLFVMSPHELANIINRIDQIEVENNQGENYFYLDEDLPRWRELLLDDSKV